MGIETQGCEIWICKGGSFQQEWSSFIVLPSSQEGSSARPSRKTSCWDKCYSWVHWGDLATKSLATKWPFWEGLGSVLDKFWRWQGNAFLFSKEKIVSIIISLSLCLPICNWWMKFSNLCNFLPLHFKFLKKFSNAYYKVHCLWL